MTGKRRANGEGSIYRRKDGRYESKYTIKDELGRSRKRSVYAKTQAECLKKLHRAQEEARRGILSTPNQDTVASFYVAWRASVAPNYLEPTTIEQYEWVFNKYVLPQIGKKRLSCLSTSDVQNLINAVYAKSKSARICKEVRCCLSGVLKRAINQRLLAYNPVSGVESPSYKPKEQHPWNITELNTFLLATSNCRYFPIFKLSSYYGMRKGEVLGLRIKDIEIGSEQTKDGYYGLIHIRQQVSLVNNIPTIRSRLKTKSSERDLPVTKEVKDLLLPLLENKEDEELLFHTKNNTPISPNNLLRAFKREAKKNNLRCVTFHSLRHTACTLLRDAGVDVKTAQVILGHADPTTTLRIYQHSDMNKKVEAMDKLSILYGNATSNVCSQ